MSNRNDGPTDPVDEKQTASRKRSFREHLCGGLARTWQSVCRIYASLNSATHFLTLLVTIAIAAIAFLQWETFEKTDKTLKAQQRAWLEPQGVTIISGLKAGEALSYQIKFTNVGKEPAINMVLQSEPQYLEVPANNTMSGYFPGKNEWCKKVRPNSEGLVVWPSAPKSIVYSVNTQPDKDILEGRKFLLIEGCFGYETVGENRFSSFCFYTRPSPDLTIDKWPVLSCMNHHNAD